MVKYDCLKEGRITMKEKRQWTLRRMKCPEERTTTELLVEWNVQKGKKVLQSISCGHPQLLDYSGADCQWLCLQKISPKK
jgi:hypothetical protein